MKTLIIIAASTFVFSTLAKSQGCIAVRNISGFGQYNLTDNAFTSTDWQLNINNRYFKAFRDFKGTENQKTPEQNESITKSYSTDITISRFLNKGWSIDFSVPILANSRETSLEHGGPNTTRHTTHAFGIGDIRLTIYKWLLQPSVSQKLNVQVGLGLKLPTGDYKYQDYFYRNDSTPVLAPVNPAIQLGDGGTGIITELNGFYIFSKHISMYGNLYYLISPREQNGASTTFGRTPTAVQIKSGNTEASVTDIFSMRGGLIFNYNTVALSAGLRNEGVPVHDLIGGSNGTRRAGYNLSFEPGIIYKLKRTTLYAYVPVIVSRKISQNVPDKKATEITGVYTLTAGGSGDYQVFFGATFKL
jgi:hypothetical protein